MKQSVIVGTEEDWDAEVEPDDDNPYEGKCSSLGFCVFVPTLTLTTNFIVTTSRQISGLWSIEVGGWSFFPNIHAAVKRQNDSMRKKHNST